MPPSTLLAEGQGEWTRKDRVLVVAHHLYEKSLCACGGPVSDWDRDVEHDVVEHTCPRCKAREEYAASKERGLGAGVKLAVMPVEHDESAEVAPVFED